MNKQQAGLARKHLDLRTKSLRGAFPVSPKGGWIRAIRQSLGMSNRQLATRMRVVPSRIPALEKAEASGATTLKSLRQAATALDCSFVYAFVPIEPLEGILRTRAAAKAEELLSRLDHTMRLENQALLRSDLEAERERLIEQIVSGSLRSLWDDSTEAIKPLV